MRVAVVVVDAATQQKQPAFDHARLAATLSKNTGNAYTTTTLPFSTSPSPMTRSR